MFGSALGNIAGTLYFLYFQLAGILIISVLLKKEGSLTKLLIGSATGSLLLQWLPVLFSFFFDFTITSHILATLPLIPAFVLAARKPLDILGKYKNLSRRFMQHFWFFVALGATLILWIYLLHTHTIPLGENGAMYAGQCTYGDMNMHLGFITSIANQETFPPDYSLFPGTKLSYPFLSDSISSSLYLFGASLRYAYILPMIFAFIQITGSIYLLAISLFGSRIKAMLTYILYMFNGGLGFAYFFDWSKEQAFTIDNIFTGFYTTPTNLVDYNIRWVNIIADMLLPQRATLFGYAILFPCIFLLHQAVWRQKKNYFLPAGIFAGALPMIHTHSFLGIGLISAAWLLLYLYRAVTPEPKRKWLGGWVLICFVAFMCFLQHKNKVTVIEADSLMLLGIGGIALCILLGIYLLVKYIRKKGWRDLLQTWGVYLLCALLLAVPQLLFWTFGQVAEGGFLRGHFNWGNQGDYYLWFYVKNLGLPLILMVGAIFAGRKQSSHLLLPVAVIWYICELIVFTPNTYDNNKLLYIAYLFLCLAAADYAVELYKQIAHIGGAKWFAVCFLFFCTISGILTLKREAVSEYQLYGTSHVELAKYIEENTDTHDVFLTNTRHNNEVASLTGRSIVCGANTFLYFHGIDTSERNAHVKLMYEAPLENMDLYEMYDVSYVLISSWERGTYAINEGVFAETFELVFNYNEVNLYKVK